MDWLTLLLFYSRPSQTLQVLSQQFHLWVKNKRRPSLLHTHPCQIMEANLFFRLNCKWVMNRKDFLLFILIRYLLLSHSARPNRLFLEIVMPLDSERRIHVEMEHGALLRHWSLQLFQVRLRLLHWYQHRLLILFCRGVLWPKQMEVQLPNISYIWMEEHQILSLTKFMKDYYWLLRKLLAILPILWLQERPILFIW